MLTVHEVLQADWHEVWHSWHSRGRSLCHPAENTTLTCSWLPVATLRTTVAHLSATGFTTRPTAHYTTPAPRTASAAYGDSPPVRRQRTPLQAPGPRARRAHAAYGDCEGRCIDRKRSANDMAVMSHLGKRTSPGAAAPAPQIRPLSARASTIRTLASGRALAATAALAICLLQAPPAGRPAPPPPVPWPSPATMELTVAATRQLHPPAQSRSAEAAATTSTPARTARPARDVAAAASRGRPLLAWPLAGPVTSGFGPRWGRHHSGIDIGSPAGTPVGAAAAGVVKRVAWIGGYGYTVEIDHGGGVTTFYAHLSRAAVRPGQEVEKGQTVGRVGETGRTTGPHLHFELRLGGEPVDPVPYLTR